MTDLIYEARQLEMKRIFKWKFFLDDGKYFR